MKHENQIDKMKLDIKVKKIYIPNYKILYGINWKRKNERYKTKKLKSCPQFMKYVYKESKEKESNNVRNIYYWTKT